MASPPTVGPRPRRDRFLVVSLLVLIAGVTGTARQAPQAPKDPSAAPSFADLGALLASLPNPAPPRFDEPRAQWFAAPPLACLDDLQARPTSRPYFWEASYKPVDGYDKVRAFYGCGDWHSAVNATWTIVKVLRQFPEISTGRLIREKLNDHLGASNFEGEVAYFKDAGAFERPYGYACLLALQSELQTWDDPQAAQWAAHMAPLTKFFSEQLVAYLKDLDRPVRTGGQTNTAVVLLAMLDASETLHDFALRSAAVEYAKKSYAKDTDCATEAEPAAGDLVSPCLAEAAVMSRVLDTAAFVPWLDAFLPAAVSPKFKPLLATSTAPVARQGGAGAAADAAQTTGGRSTPPAAATPERQGGGRAGGAPGGGRGGAGASGRAAPIALAFARSDAFSRLAAALPASDPRVSLFRRLATIHADAGARALSEPDALDAPWLGAFAIRTFSTSRGDGR